MALARGDRLVLFSDGLFEITDHDGRPWRLGDLAGLLARAEDLAPRALFDAVRAVARAGALEDDCCVLVMRVS